MDCFRPRNSRIYSCLSKLVVFAIRQIAYQALLLAHSFVCYMCVVCKCWSKYVLSCRYSGSSLDMQSSAEPFIGANEQEALSGVLCRL